MVKRMLFALVCCVVMATAVQARPRQVRIRGGDPDEPMKEVAARPGETVTFEAWVWQRNPDTLKWMPLPHVTIYWEVRDVKGVKPKVISLGHATTRKNGHVTATFTIPEDAKPCKNAKYVAQFNAVPGELNQARNNGKLIIEK
ncbi:MAG: hypothetical protein JW955_26035 [Sedimentisphaerales bacterium]|nr:hypothetical protein [Sedimentisphaerales bacterium]